MEMSPFRLLRAYSRYKAIKAWQELSQCTTSTPKLLNSIAVLACADKIAICKNLRLHLCKIVA